MEDILTWAHTVLTTTPTRWTELAGKVPAELLTRPPTPGEWSAQACLQHLVDTERWVFPARIEALLAGRDFAAFDPDSQGTKAEEAPSVEQLANEFARLRADNLRLLQTVTPADLKRQARHQELGLVTLAELLHHWAGHDLMHTVQAERALLQPFIQGCGPWQAYFSDHVA